MPSDVLELLAELICIMPAVSAYAAHKMKEAGLFITLIDLLRLKEWKSHAVHAIARWSCHDRRYVDSQMTYDATIQLLYPILQTEIKHLTSPKLCSDLLPDFTIIVQHCPSFAQKVLDDELINLAITVINEADDSEKSEVIEFLIQLILQTKNPSSSAYSVWQYCKSYTESTTFNLQRSALRLLVISH
jgi:hypothetical protein